PVSTATRPLRSKRSCTATPAPWVVRPRSYRRASLRDDRAVPSVRLASYNAHWGLHRYGGDLDLTAIVAALDADVVCLQEVWRRADGHAAHEVAARALGYHLVEARI